MHIAYVSTYDARDPRNWSGLGYHIARALEAAGCELEYIGPLQERFSAYFRAKTLLYRKLRHQAFQRDREPAVLDGYARQVEERLQLIKPDVIFSPGTVPIAHLRTSIPIAFWTDATYASVQEAYRWELPAVRKSIVRGHAMEQRALDRANLAIYSSDWAAESAMKRYRADPAKVKVVPFGANIQNPPGQDEIDAFIDQRPTEKCNLLFVGTGWERKGGDIAVETARLLNEQGVATTLRIAGHTPEHVELPEFASKVGFIDKAAPEGAAEFAAVFAGSHFLIHPARAEASAVVLCEAGAFGVPVIATRIGGTPSIIRDGVNGMLFDCESPREMASAIATLVVDRPAYRALCQGAFKESRERLNWDVAGAAVRKLLESL